MKVFAAFVSALLLAGVCCKSADEQRKDAVKRSGDILMDLYVTLRNIVFPESPLSDGVTHNRFVLLSPGKVLNYWDYYPGEDYEESLLRRNTSAPEVMIPPAVMEKWFDIADVMVGADPFTGGVTSQSMAKSYETILSQMDILGIETKSQDAQSKYNMARNYLVASVKDPDNVTLNTTRLSLYDRYQNLYTQLRLEMEDAINEARRTKGSTEYELWFQRHFPALNSRVEGAYIKWLTFGEKDIVELYKAYLDSASAGSEVEEARMSLRASGVRSLDRTRTIYPVSFEPGNWYKYLLPDNRGPSRDMLIARKSLLVSERDALESMKTLNSNNAGEANKTLDQLKGKLNISTEQRNNKTQESIASRIQCMKQNSQQSPPGGNSSAAQLPDNGPCNKYKQANEDAVTATFQQAQVNSELQSAAFLLHSNKQFNHFLGARVDSLNREIDSIDAELNVTSNVYLGGVVDSNEFRNLEGIRNQTEQSLNDAWTAFEYSSDSSHIKTEQETNSLNVAASIGVTAPKGYGFQASGYYGKGTTDLNQALNSASMTISGELLRVVIKRPWFRPSIFDDSSLSFLQRNEAEQKNTYVSPGPSSEKTLRDVIGGGTDNLYLLPEYVSSFLLAHNVKLQYSGVDANSVSHAMQMMAGGSFSGNYGMFSMSASVGISKTKQSINADRTANGMIITIPGAQIIGYFTEVLPQFPRSQK